MNSVKYALTVSMLMVGICFAQQPVRPRPKKPTAQPTAPQPETALLWLQEKIRTNGETFVDLADDDRAHPYHTWWSITGQAMNYSGCAVEYKYTQDRKHVHDNPHHSVSSVRTTTVSFNLGDLSPSASAHRFQPLGLKPLGPMPWCLTLRARSGAKIIHGHNAIDKGPLDIGPDGTPLPVDFDVAEFPFFFDSDSEDIAKRAVGAIQDAVLACGGTKEVY